MEQQTNTLEGGVWMVPEKACKYFRYGRGITHLTLMNKIYQGQLKKYVKWTPQGWLVFVTNEMIETLKTA